MKKIISILWALALIAALPFQVCAAECEHSYSSAAVPASCIEKGHTLYSCTLCEHSYKVYDDEYDPGESFFIVATDERTEDTVTVTVALYNNPGLLSSRLQVKYNSEALAPAEFINGDIWTADDFPNGKVKLDRNPVTVYNEAKNTEIGYNYTNGTFFTIVFNILDSSADYEISFSHAKGDFARWDYETNSILKFTPVIANLIGKSELGDHSYEAAMVAPTCEEEGYTAYTCRVCSDSYRDSTVPAKGHSWEFSKNVLEPDFDNPGEALFVCSDCSAEKTESIPVLEHYKKGDINGDGKYSAIDANFIKRHIVGATPTLQQYDAADINSDGAISATDSYLLLLLILGK